jgi:hypothetical protein
MFGFPSHMTVVGSPLAVLAKVLEAKASGASAKVLAALDAEFSLAVILAS